MFHFLKKTYLWVLLIPSLLFFLGAASNQAVLVANWGKFPVMVNNQVATKLLAENSTEESENFSIFNTKVAPLKTAKETTKKSNSDLMIDDDHCIMTHQTHLNALGDWINLKIAILSPGDLLVELGDFLLSFAPIIWIVLIIRKLAFD